MRGVGERVQVGEVEVVRVGERVRVRVGEAEVGRVRVGEAEVGQGLVQGGEGHAVVLVHTPATIPDQRVHLVRAGIGLLQQLATSDHFDYSVVR